MIRIRLLGDVSIRNGAAANGGRLLGEPTRFSVLAFIAASRNAYGCREELKRLLWPDSPRARAQNALRQALHRIRSELGPDALISEGLRLEVNREVVDVDVARFQHRLAAGSREEALEAYGGDLLEGFPALGRKEFDDWVEARRLQLRRCALDAAESLAEDREAAGAYHDAAHWWRIAVTLSPFDEVNLRRWMRALALEGSRGRALKVYEDAVGKLENELDAQPALATRRLAQRIRTEDDLGAIDIRAH